MIIELETGESFIGEEISPPKFFETTVDGGGFEEIILEGLLDGQPVRLIGRRNFSSTCGYYGTEYHVA